MSRPTPPSSTSAALGAFAHLPAYEFDYDYRGDSIRPAATTPSPLTSPPSTSVPPPLATATVPRVQPERPQYSPLVDDFDSYMFPDVESPAYPDDDPRHLLYSPSDSTDTTTLSTLTDQQRLQRAHTDAPAASPRPRQPVDWRAVDAATLYSPNATSMDPDKLYTGYSSQVVLVFVPRHAVELAGLVYGKVAHLLQQAGARLVFITAWAPDQALTFLSRFERVSPFPGALVCDPHAALFSAFGFTRSPLRALFATPKVSAPMRQGMRNAFSTVSYRAANRDIATTPVSSKLVLMRLLYRRLMWHKCLLVLILCVLLVLRQGLLMRKKQIVSKHRSNVNVDLERLIDGIRSRGRDDVLFTSIERERER